MEYFWGALQALPRLFPHIGEIHFRFRRQEGLEKVHQRIVEFLKNL